MLGSRRSGGRRVVGVNSRDRRRKVGRLGLVVVGREEYEEVDPGRCIVVGTLT